jgi:hypothetical protein
MDEGIDMRRVRRKRIESGYEIPVSSRGVSDCVICIFAKVAVLYEGWNGSL